MERLTDCEPVQRRCMKGKTGMWLCTFIVALTIISAYSKGIRTKE